MRWNLIKAGFFRQLRRGKRISSSRMNKCERGVWQRRFCEHLISDDGDYMRHVDYVHYDPVKHGYTRAPAAWRFSSIHRYIKNGIIPADWGAATVKDVLVRFEGVGIVGVPIVIPTYGTGLIFDLDYRLRAKEGLIDRF